MSHEEENLTPGERELEAALGGLRPAAPRFTLEMAQARALLADQRQRTRIWQAVAALLAIAAGAAFLLKPAARTVEVEKIVYRAAPANDVRMASAESADTQPIELANGELAYLKLRDKVLSRGVNSLRATREAPAAGRAPSMMGEGRGGDGQPVGAPWYVDYLVSGGRL